MKAAQDKNGNSSRVIKLRSSVHNKLRTLVASVSLKGWQHFGATRDERATMSSVIEEAIDQLIRRASREKTGR